jgi:hypothetical protein
VLLGSSIVAGGVAWRVGVQLTDVGPLLTATSIFTGLVFGLALSFWGRSMDADRDPAYLADGGARLPMLAEMTAYLVWTVVVGVVGTGYLAALLAFRGDAAPTPTALSAVAVAIVAYQLLLVLGAVARLYVMSYTLRD